MIKVGNLLFIFILLIFCNACDSGPTPIMIGKDNCDYCKMMITETKYASELVSPKGKILKFDSIECLAAYSALNSHDAGSSLWVPNFKTGKDFINVKNAFFLISPNMKSPMSLNISSHSTKEDLNKIKEEYGGKQLTWKEVINYVKNEWNL